MNLSTIFPADDNICKTSLALTIDIFSNWIAAKVQIRYIYWYLFCILAFQLQQGCIDEDVFLFPSKNQSILEIPCIFEKVKPRKKIWCKFG